MEDILAAIPPAIWEEAFLGQAECESIDAEAVLKQALSGAAFDNVDEILGSVEPGDEILEVLYREAKCTVGIEFPESMHGDAIWVAFSHFPGGTAVGGVSDSWSGTNRIFVVPKATASDLSRLAYDAIDSLQDGADWSCFEEGEETPEEGNPAQYFGFQELLENWPNRAGDSSI